MKSLTNKINDMFLSITEYFSHMISHMKPEFHIWNEKFHIWNWNFTCEIKISHMNYRISYMKPNNSYVKNYMWNRITYEFLDSYMKFLYVKTNHIWNLYVKTYHIWNPQFIYEILYVKTYHIWNPQFIYEILYVKTITYEIYMWKQITYEILYVKTNHIWNPRFIYEILYVKINHILNLRFIYEYQYVKTNRIWNPKFIHVYVLYHRNTQFILDWISHTCITYEFSHREYSNLPACYYWIFNTTLTPKKVKNQIVYNYI